MHSEVKNPSVGDQHTQERGDVDELLVVARDVAQNDVDPQRREDAKERAAPEHAAQNDVAAQEGQRQNQANAQHPHQHGEGPQKRHVFIEEHAPRGVQAGGDVLMHAGMLRARRAASPHRRPRDVRIG